MRRVSTRLALFGLAAGYALLTASCRERGARLPQTGATLEGTITYGGERVPFAVVTVVGENWMATGNVGEDGRYKVDNAPLGEVKIGVNTDAARGELQSKAMAQSYTGPGGKGKAKAPLPKFVAVPAKFAEPETSGIKTTVNKGANTFDIVIPR